MVSLVVVLCGVSAAGSRHTIEAITLRKKPGEKQPSVAQVGANIEVTVLAEEGRWLRVRVNNTEGYTPRTTISDDAVAAVGPPAWSAARHDRDLQVETISAGAMLSAPKPDSPRLGDVAKGARLSVLDATTTPGWIHARDGAGHDGWIASSLVENSATGVNVTKVDLQGSTRDDFARPDRMIRGEVALGYRSLGMDLSSNAEGGLTNYLVDADAVAAVASLDVRRELGMLVLAADGRAELSESSPGIEYLGPTSPSGKIPFTTVGADLGVRAGVRVKQAIDLALRAGGHYDAFLPSNVENVGMLPRERLLGATLGARIEVAPPHSRIGLTARFDALVIGSRAQTSGLEDGQHSTAHALWGGLAVRYTLGWIAPFIALDLGRATTTWTGMSNREAGVSDAHRTDSTQLMQIGISAEL